MLAFLLDFFGAVLLSPTAFAAGFVGADFLLVVDFLLGAAFFAVAFLAVAFLVPDLLVAVFFVAVFFLVVFLAPEADFFPPSLGIFHLLLPRAVVDL